MPIPNDALKGKLAPDEILYAMSELNMNASDTLYIGDMDVDYACTCKLCTCFVGIWCL